MGHACLPVRDVGKTFHVAMRSAGCVPWGWRRSAPGVFFFKCGKLLEKLQEVRQYFASTEIPQLTSDEPLGPRFALVLGQRIACRVSSTRWQRATQAVPRLPSPPRQEAWVAVNACRDRRVRSVCSGCMRRRSSIVIEPFSCDRLLGGPHRVRLEFAESARLSPPTSTVWPGMNVDLMLNVSCCLQLPGTGMDCRLGKRGKRSDFSQVLQGGILRLYKRTLTFSQNKIDFSQA